MKLFSSGVCKKPSLSEPEDLVDGNKGFYWLLDGATPPVGENGHALTYRYVQTLNRALKTNAQIAKTPEELLYRSIHSVRDDFNENGINVEWLPSSTVVLVQVLQNCLNYLVLGDSYLCIRTEKDDLVITDDRLKFVAVEERKIVRRLREDGFSEESSEYLAARRNLIFAELECRNKDEGYWIAELDPDAAKKSKQGTVHFQRDEVVTVLAVTDGLERLVSIFDFYHNLNDLGDAILREGEIQVFNQLRELEKEPKAFKKAISSKHDDASYFLLVN